MEYEALRDKIAEENPEALFAEGFEDALVGTATRFGYSGPLACYDLEKCIQILVERDEMEWEEAVEFMDFNVLGAWMGDGTPVFIEVLRIEGISEAARTM